MPPWTGTNSFHWLNTADLHYFTIMKSRQTADKKGGCMTSVLLKPHRERQRPIAFFSFSLELLAADLPLYMEQLKKVVLTWHDHAGYSELMLLVLTVSLRKTKYTFISCLLVKVSKKKKNSVVNYNKNAKTFNKKVTNSNVHTILLEIPNVRVKSGPVLNSASLLTTDADGEPHNYREVVSKTNLTSSGHRTWHLSIRHRTVSLFRSSCWTRGTNMSVWNR